MSKFNVDITQNVQPAAPSAASMVQAEASRGKVAAGAIGALGGTIWDAVKGYEVAQLQGQQEAEVGQLQEAMRDIKAVDIYNKAEATTFTPETEEPVVESFRQRQKALAAARDQMPQRYREMMLRAESNLKAAIAKYPGLADAFRAASYEATGLKGLDMYSVNNLYNEIGTIEKQQQDAAAAAAKAQEDALRYFIKDMAPSIGETAAAEMFKKLTPEERVRYASEAVGAENARKGVQDALKAGGNALLNVSTGIRAEFEANMGKVQAQLYGEFEKLGVTRAMLATGDIPENIRNSEAFRNLLNKGNTELLNILDNSYQQGISALQSRSNVPADASSARQALNDLQEWHRSTREFVGKHGALASLIAGTQADPNKTLQQRLSIVKSLVDVYAIPPDVAANLMSLGDSKIYADAVRRYPAWSQALGHINKLVGVALRMGTEKEWVETIKMAETFRAGGNNGAPKTPKEAAGSMLNYQQLKSSVVDMAYPNADVSQAPTVIPDFVRAAFVDPANAEQFLKTGLPATTTTLAKLPSSEQKLVKDAIVSRSLDSLYGAVGHGDEAKKRYDAVLRGNLPFDVSINPETMQVVGTMRPPKPGEPLINIPSKQSIDFSLRNVNNTLKAVDNVIRIRAALTGEDVATLRKEFIEALSKPGNISDNATSILNKSTGVSLGGVDQAGAALENALATNKPLPKGQTFASTPEEMDIARILRDELVGNEELLKRVSDPTQKRRIESNIKAIKEEMQRQGVK